MQIFNNIFFAPETGARFTMTTEIHADVQTSVVALALSHEQAGNMFDLPMIHETIRPIHAAADHAHCVMTTLTSRDLMSVMA